MSTNKQRRQAARRHQQRQLARRATRRRVLRQRLIVGGIVVSVLLVVGAVWLFTGGSSDEAGASGAGPGPVSPSEGYDDGAVDADPAAGTATDGPGDGDAGTSGTEACAYPASDRPASRTVDPPDPDLTPHGTVDVTLTLDRGEVDLRLDADRTPCTVGSFVSLADQGYFDDTTCHRLTTSPSLQVLQCGDPSASGAGGPGYSFADELDGTETYPAGTVAMANAGPNTNGSQFFLVYADSQLPPDYTVFGRISDGLQVLRDIAAAGTDSGGTDGEPAQPVTIESVTVDG